MREIKLTPINNKSKALQDWLKKFTAVSKEIIMAIDFDNEKFVISAFNEEKSVVKHSTLSFADASFCTNTTTGFTKIGILNLPTVIKALDDFTGEDFTIALNILTEAEDKGVESIEVDVECASFQIYSKSMKLKFKCVPMSYLEYIDEEKMARVKVISDDNTYSFVMSESAIAKVKKASSYETAFIYISFKAYNGALTISGESFEIDLGHNVPMDTDTSIIISSTQFKLLDMEDYTVTISPDKLLCTAINSDTTCFIAKYTVD